MAGPDLVKDASDGCSAQETDAISRREDESDDRRREPEDEFESLNRREGDTAGHSWKKDGDSETPGDVSKARILP